MPTGKTFKNSIGMEFVRIEPGSFMMGHDAQLPAHILDAKEAAADRKVWLPENGDYDERPVHKVTITRPFYMGVREVTNQEYEQFKRMHVRDRGRLGFSIDHNEAAVFVSWEEAKAFCDWLSRKEGLLYRLPTEAEWEYAARAGTTTLFPSGDTLPAEFVKNPDNSWYPNPHRGRGRAEVVPIHVGRTPANPWGLFDMHGNVEEWCLDWYGPYEAGDHVDPVGRASGYFRVTRGGSHSTFPFYMRSANRMGTVPENKNWYIGFRVVLGEMPATKPLPAVGPTLFEQNVRQAAARPAPNVPDRAKPYFRGPLEFVKIPAGSLGPLYDRHNHSPSISEAPNGDLIAIWYTTVTERGREIAVAASRLRYGASEWDRASPFWDAPDRNDHTPVIWFDGEKTLYHFQGFAPAATWGPMAVFKRTSTDNGVTWSRPVMILPEHTTRQQLIPAPFRTKEGFIVLPADASPSGNGGSALLISRDNGETFVDAEGTIAGIHTGVAQLRDGRLFAFGRGDAIDGKMPQSISSDMGKTWTHSASQFPPIEGGQRLVLRRLKEGPLLLLSFANEPITIADASGERRQVKGMFAALSYDDGKTWPKIRLVSDDGPGREVASSDGRAKFVMSHSSAEPRGYMAGVQGANGVFHVITSRNHYSFNLKWLEAPAPPVKHSEVAGQTNSLGMKLVRIEPGNFAMGVESEELPDEAVTTTDKSRYASWVLKNTPAARWEGLRPGLVGVLYGESEPRAPDLTGPRHIRILPQLDLNWAAEKPRNRTWSARWRGWVKALVSGPVTFAVEFTGPRKRDLDQGVRLFIDHARVLDGWGSDKPRAASVQMNEGRQTRLTLECVYSQEQQALRLYWSWAGREKTLIPGEAFSYAADDYNAAAIDLAWLDQPASVVGRLKGGDYDEHPRHQVTITPAFYISETEVTVEQFQQFRADYGGDRDYSPYASGVSWDDAVAFCEWLSRKEGKPYRLPTEAEWEYACRAGTTTPFSSGNRRPEAEVPNAWGLKNMHTGVLEWVLDWHGLYPDAPQTDPVGRAHGFAKVVRGGGLDVMGSRYGGESAEMYMLRVPGEDRYFGRCANRASVAPAFGLPPADYRAKQHSGSDPPEHGRLALRSPYRAGGLVPGTHHIGFRVVQASMPKTAPLSADPPHVNIAVKQSVEGTRQGPDAAKPYYRTRAIFPDLRGDSMREVGWKIGLAPGVGTRWHNSALAACQNGDLLGAYYNSIAAEDEPDQSIALLRLRHGAEEWDLPAAWPDFADAADAAPVLWNDRGRIWLFWGATRINGGHPFQYMTSDDNGASWSPVQFPRFESRIGSHTSQPINSALRAPDGTIYLGVDGGNGSSSLLFASKNEGKTWYDTGGRTFGRHSVFAFLKDGAILSLDPRGRDLDGFMPKSISRDGGRTYRMMKTDLPALGGGQRPTLIRLASGRLLYAGDRYGNKDRTPEKNGAFVAVSDDEGNTWRRRMLGGANTVDQQGRPVKITTAGYTSAAQAANGVIHLVTSQNSPNLHIELNEAWILEGDQAGESQPLVAARLKPGTTRAYSENYPNGNVKATWSAGDGEDGRYLLHNVAVFYHDNGRKQWEARYVAGRKVGTETYWNAGGIALWQRVYYGDGTHLWRVFDREGKLRAESRWRGKSLLSRTTGGN